MNIFGFDLPDSKNLFIFVRFEWSNTLLLFFIIIIINDLEIPNHKHGSYEPILITISYLKKQKTF